MHLASLQGTRGAVIPGYADLPAHVTIAIVAQVAADLYPHKGRSAALSALQANPDAPRLIKEAAAAYCASSAPAMPAAAPVSYYASRSQRRSSRPTVIHSV
jgi:hypothetical protein